MAVAVLVVEDDAADRLLVREALLPYWSGSYTLEESADLQSALARLGQGGIDAVLLDLQLPDAQGLQALQLLAPANVPVVVLTGHDDPAIGDAALHAGAADFLSKRSVTPELLERTLRYAVLRHGRRLHRESLDLPLFVLHVEDDPADRDLVMQALASFDGEVKLHAVETLQEALPLARTAHVVLLDMGLPDSRGPETVRILAAAAPHASMVVVTQTDDFETAQDALAAGASDYLVKGLLMPEQLHRALDFAVSMRAWEEA
jgi:CheY-like chemotaxis protein